MNEPFSHRLRRAPFVLAGFLPLGLLVASCEQSPPCEAPISSTVISERLTQSKVDKIDLLLAIDNSRGMADKQQIFAISGLVQELANPPCIDPNGGDVEIKPAGSLYKCPDGLQRKHEPILDIHVGIISSSLGGHGSDACSPSGAGKQSNNDKAHLLARKDPAAPSQVETYQNLGFLAWDPAQKLQPPGEADIDQDTGTDANMTSLSKSLEDMVMGVGQIGCGYEAQLESWYRFLIDPSPPEEVTLDADGKVLLQGVDTVLLDQRKHFLRPDSLLTIVMLTDENDCSIREQGQFYYAAQQKGANGAPFHLPKGRAICDQSPNDPCCYSCGQIGPKDDDGNPICPEDPTCKTADGMTAYHDDLSDNINLRCWDQKRRFGIDFLYGIDRYADGLRNPTVTDRNGQVVPNPLYTDLDPNDASSNVRTPSLVFLAGIVGVPWQDIARTNQNGAPDLRDGLDMNGKPRGGFRSADELNVPLPGKDYNTWDVILGDPDNYPAVEALPKDPLMLERVEARTGVNPITGHELVTSAQPLGNVINGHEWSIPARDDLQFACIFPLAVPRDCSTGLEPGCDCEDPTNDSPLCQVNPATGEPTTQVYAKAHPGIRELQLLKAIGSQGIVASICPAQVNDPSEVDFGYRAALQAVSERLESAIAGQCLQRTLVPNEMGQVPCLMIEALRVEESNAAACNACNEAGRDPIDLGVGHGTAVDAIKEENPEAGYNCFCVLTQLANDQGTPSQLECKQNYNQPGYDLCACQYTPPDQSIDADGWCYIDAQQNIGDPEIVEACPATEQRILRFAGEGAPRSGSSVFITCVTDTAHDLPAACASDE